MVVSGAAVTTTSTSADEDKQRARQHFCLRWYEGNKSKLKMCTSRGGGGMGGATCNSVPFAFTVDGDQPLEDRDSRIRNVPIGRSVSRLVASSREMFFFNQKERQEAAVACQEEQEAKKKTLASKAQHNSLDTSCVTASATKLNSFF